MSPTGLRAAPVLRLPWSLALAVAGGLALWAAFPPLELGWAAVVGVALVTLAAWRSTVRRGLLVGLVAGFAFFAPLLEWMRVIGVDAWLALTLLCAMWLALTSGATALVSRLPAAPVWIAAVWVLQEALRARIPFGGFPWGLLGFAQPDTPIAGWAWLGGVPAASCAVAFAGAAVAYAAIRVTSRPRAWRAAGAWAVGGVVLAIAPLALTPLVRPPLDQGADPAPSADSGRTATIAVVQGGTPQLGMGAMDVRRAVLDNHVAQTLDLATAIAAGTAPQPAFVLWPENSSDLDLFTDPSAAEAVTAAARAVGAPILVGVVVAVPGRTDAVWNMGVVWDPVAGPTQGYRKNHPVPFGEYVPFRSLLAPLISRFDRVPRDFLAGTEPGNLDLAGIAVGDVICFEIAYGSVVDAVVDGGAEVITVQTNNATYGGTSQPAQQLQISRIRAIETGRSVLVAATSGISAVIDADGTVTERLDVAEQGWLVPEVRLGLDRSPATRFGWLVELSWVLIALAALAVAVGLGRRRSGAAGPGRADGAGPIA